MKKAISILLALCLLLLAGCFGPKQALRAVQQAAAGEKESLPIPEAANAAEVLEEAADPPSRRKHTPNMLRPKARPLTGSPPSSMKTKSYTYP